MQGRPARRKLQRATVGQAGKRGDKLHHSCVEPPAIFVAAHDTLSSGRLGVIRPNVRRGHRSSGMIRGLRRTLKQRQSVSHLSRRSVCVRDLRAGGRVSHLNSSCWNVKDDALLFAVDTDSRCTQQETETAPCAPLQ